MFSVLDVDAASGGFVAPFVDPNLSWDFRLDKVASINVSGHKYGLVYAGIGWLLWRGPEYLPAGSSLETLTAHSRNHAN